MKGKAVNHVKVLYELVNKCGEVCDDRQNGILEVKSGKIALTKTSSIATTVDSVPMVGRILIQIYAHWVTPVIYRLRIKRMSRRSFKSLRDLYYIINIQQY
jgi:hypothetical protein